MWHHWLCGVGLSPEFTILMPLTSTRRKQMIFVIVTVLGAVSFKSRSYCAEELSIICFPWVIQWWFFSPLSIPSNIVGSRAAMLLTTIEEMHLLSKKIFFNSLSLHASKLMDKVCFQRSLAAPPPFSYCCRICSARSWAFVVGTFCSS